MPNNYIRVITFLRTVFPAKTFHGEMEPGYSHQLPSRRHVHREGGRVAVAGHQGAVHRARHAHFVADEAGVERIHIGVLIRAALAGDVHPGIGRLSIGGKAGARIRIDEAAVLSGQLELPERLPAYAEGLEEVRLPVGDLSTC